MPNDYLKFALVPAAAVMVSSCGFNEVPTAEEAAKAKWADVQSAYQRRADLVPNLVEAVKGAMQQEQDVLIGVTEARAKASSTQISAEDLTDPTKVAAFQAAQSELGGALSRLLVTVEAYPQIKSNENVLALQSQLEGTENRISVARRDYNEAVRQYNTTIRTFPAIVAAKVIYGAEAMETFTATTEGAEEAPQIDMTPGQ